MRGCYRCSLCPLYFLVNSKHWWRCDVVFFLLHNANTISLLNELWSRSRFWIWVLKISQCMCSIETGWASANLKGPLMVDHIHFSQCKISVDYTHVLQCKISVCNASTSQIFQEWFHNLIFCWIISFAGLMLIICLTIICLINITTALFSCLFS